MNFPVKCLIRVELALYEKMLLLEKHEPNKSERSEGTLSTNIHEQGITLSLCRPRFTTIGKRHSHSVRKNALPCAITWPRESGLVIFAIVGLAVGIEETITAKID